MLKIKPLLQKGSQITAHINQLKQNKHLSLTSCLTPAGAAAQRPGEGVCHQRLRGLQHTEGAAEIRPWTNQEEEEDEEEEEVVKIRDRRSR